MFAVGTLWVARKISGSFFVIILLLLSFFLVKLEAVIHMSSHCFEAFNQLELGPARSWTSLALMDINSWSCRAPGARRNLNICNCSEIFALRCFSSAQAYSSLSNGPHCSVSGGELVVAMFFYSLYVLLFFLWSFPLTASYKCFGELCECLKASLLATLHSPFLCFLFLILHLFALLLQCSKTAGTEISVLKNKRITGVRYGKSLHGMNNSH